MSHLTIYRASAGAGKTFTLVKEYLKIVLVNPWDYRHVLAITFTNKATEEMKSRIMDTLAEMASSTPEELRAMPMYQDIKQHLLLNQKADPETVIKNARQTLHRILADYSNFSVSTIESFFQKIIRAFSRELNIPLGYEIDMRRDVVLEEIMQSSLKQAGRDAEVTRLLNQFLERNLEEEKGWRIEGGIRKLGEQLFTERFQAELIKDDIDYAQRRQDILDLEKELRALIAKADNYMVSLAKEALGAIEMADLTIKDFSYGISGPAGHFVKIVEKKEYEMGKRAKTAAKEGEGWVKKNGGSPIALELAEETLTDILLQIHDYWESNKRRYQSAKVILKRLLEFALLFDLQERLTHYRETKNLLLISDTNSLLKQVVGDQETPFVYEKVGNRYYYFLIDEFQDTSDMQWANLLPLLTNVLAQGYHSLLVGDVKQSIFRWRNGNPELLLYRAGQEIQRQGAKVKEESLQSNWRTAPRIVKFNNRFFPLFAEYFAQNYGETGQRYLRDAYADVAQKPERTTEGYISVESYAKKVDKEKLDWEQAALDRTLAIIREAIDDGFALQDIVMLVRTNRQGSMLAAWLQENGYKVASPDALSIDNDEQVQFLIAVLRWLEEPKEKLYRANLAWFARKIYPEQNPVHGLFTDSEAHIPEALVAQAASLRRMAVLPCLERICQLFPALQEPNAFVSALMEQALDISNKQNTSLAGFLQHWDEEGHKQKVAVGDSTSSLQLMTIHKAKGLEFPIVIMPFTDWATNPGNTTLWVSSDRAPFDKVPYYPVSYNKSLEQSYFEAEYAEEGLKSHLDNINLLYVAFTRPKYRLYVITSHEKSNRSNRLVKPLLDIIEEMEPDEAEETEYYRGYHWGKALTKSELVTTSEEEESQAINLAANPDPLLPWEGAVRIRLAVGRFLRADRVALEEAASAGELLHEALARIEVLDDIPDAMEQLVARGLLATQDADIFETAVRKTLEQPQLKDWFSGGWEVKNEMSILRPDGNILRPDRVMTRGNEIVVLDYKTGKQRDSHENQIAAYMDAIREIRPEAEISGYLYYTDQKKLV